MLLGPLLVIYVVEYAHGAPVVLISRVIGLGDLAHDLADRLGVLDVEMLLVVPLYKLQSLFRRGDIAHISYLLNFTVEIMILLAAGFCNGEIGSALVAAAPDALLLGGLD